MSKEVCILAFDAAGHSCAAAVLRGENVLAERQEEMERGQAERLIPLIEETLQAAGVGHDALDALAVTVGPGAFTGVRIGLAAARGYGLALGIPQIGITSLEALAAAPDMNERRGRCTLALIDAKRRDFFAQIFDDGLTPLGKPFSATVETLASRLPQGGLLLVGNAIKQARPALARHPFPVLVSAAASHCSAAQVARLAGQRFQPGGDYPAPAPLYLRAPDVTLPKRAAPAVKGPAAR